VFTGRFAVWGAFGAILGAIVGRSPDGAGAADASRPDRSMSRRKGEIASIKAVQTSPATAAATVDGTELASLIARGIIEKPASGSHRLSFLGYQILREEGEA
jgi:hypothetical protein